MRFVMSAASQVAGGERHVVHGFDQGNDIVFGHVDMFDRSSEQFFSGEHDAGSFAMGRDQFGDTNGLSLRWTYGHLRRELKPGFGPFSLHFGALVVSVQLNPKHWPTERMVL